MKTIMLWSRSEESLSELYLFILEVAFIVPSNNKPALYTSSWIEYLKRRPVITNKLAQVIIGVSGMRQNGENTAQTLFLYMRWPLSVLQAYPQCKHRENCDDPLLCDQLIVNVYMTCVVCCYKLTRKR